MRCPMVTEKPMDRAADPRRPFLLSSVTAKMQTTSCMVRKTSTVVAIPRLMPGCSWRWTRGQKQIEVWEIVASGIDLKYATLPELMLTLDTTLKNQLIIIC